MTFLELMEQRKTNSSNLLMYLFNNHREYEETSRKFINLLEDLILIEHLERKNFETDIQLKTGIHIKMKVCSDIQKLYGYKYYDFRLFGVFEDFIPGPMPILGELFKDDNE